MTLTPQATSTVSMAWWDLDRPRAMVKKETVPSAPTPRRF